VDEKHEAAGRRWKRQNISAHIELPGLGLGESRRVGSMRLLEEGEKYRIWSI
jgi:hypothetical protein